MVDLNVSKSKLSVLFLASLSCTQYLTNNKITSINNGYIQSFALTAKLEAFLMCTK